jgi:hypothetical protein
VPISANALRTGGVAALRLPDPASAYELFSAIPKKDLQANDLGLMAECCIALKQYQKAKKLQLASLKMNPKDYISLNRMAVIETELQHFPAAERYIAQSRQEGLRQTMKPFTAPLLNLAYLNQIRGKYKQAISCYTVAVEEEPMNIRTRTWLALAQLTVRQVHIGLENYECRMLHDCALPRNGTKLWQGEATEHLVLYHEQGLGDGVWMFSFLRDESFWSKYPQIKQVTLVTDPRLAALFRVQNVVRKDNAFLKIATPGEQIDPHTFHLPLMSLFKFRLKNKMPVFYAVPQGVSEVNFLDELNLNFWPDLHHKLDRPELYVGVCFNGNPSHLNDRFRSLTPPQALALVQALKAKGCRVFLMDNRPADPAIVAAGLETPDIPDLVCLSSIAHQMDCIITVDTLCAHVAAGVNTKTIMMSAANPDFRWGLNDTVKDVAYLMQNFQVVRQKKVGVWTPEEIQAIVDLCV